MPLTSAVRGSNIAGFIELCLRMPPRLSAQQGLILARPGCKLQSERQAGRNAAEGYCEAGQIEQGPGPAHVRTTRAGFVSGRFTLRRWSSKNVGVTKHVVYRGYTVCERSQGVSIAGGGHCGTLIKEVRQRIAEPVAVTGMFPREITTRLARHNELL